MIFTPLPIAGAWMIDIEAHVDERGLFARTWCRDEFAAHGLPGDIAQQSVSLNRLAGTVRGMHFTRPPGHEAKLVRCTAGRAHDVLVDLRPGSASFLRHAAVELDARTHRAVFVPSGVAHGFQALCDDTELLYLMDSAHAPEHAFGVRHDDPAIDVRWPLPVRVISARDRRWPDVDLRRLQRGASGHA